MKIPSVILVACAFILFVAITQLPGGQLLRFGGEKRLWTQSVTLKTHRIDQFDENTQGPSNLLAEEEAAEANVQCPEVNITVAYNVFIWPPQNWKFLVGSQLQDLAYSGLHHCAQMVIAISVPEEHNNLTYIELQDMMKEAVRFVRQQEVGRDAIVIQEHENAFEYPAIHSIYRMANSEPDDVAHNHLFLYFHTKGMVKHGKLKRRIDEGLFNATIVPWRAVAQQFLAHDDIRAAAWMPSSAGWGWYNFWWARGDFVKKLKKPRRDVKRHWFESWLGIASKEAKKGTKVLSTCTCDFLAVNPSGIRQAAKKCVKVTPETCST